MERRVYFILGDLLACAVIAAAAGLLTQSLIPVDWAAAPIVILIGMLIGLLIGLFAGIFGGFLFAPFFGAMELILPVTLSGTAGGMLTGMLHPLAGLTPGEAIQGGILVGILCLVFTYLLQTILHGEVK